MGRPCVVAIDGEAASGKSTIGGRLADQFHYLYLDTGALYRAVTWAALENKLTVADEEAITALARSLPISVTTATETDGRQYSVFADGRDITWSIREPQVDAAVSTVSAYPGVRLALTRLMREIAAERCVVMVGRDIGTVVLPNAELKLYMTASVEERAKRRFRELSTRGESTSYEEVLASMRRRDEVDSHRQHAPLKAATDAVTVSTDGRTADEVFAWILGMIEERWPEKG